MNSIIKQDIEHFVKHFQLSDDLTNSIFLITGATGLIGSCLIRCLIELDKNIRIIAPVRNKTKAQLIFEDNSNRVEFFECDIFQYNYDLIGDVDYIIHCAAPTSSLYFIEHPVETFNIILEGTKVLLEYACKHPVKSFVYLSSLEVYGEIHDDSVSITENIQGYIDPISVRSSYPMAKRAAENLCCLYASEFAVPIKIARLTQTTGAGIAMDDNRIIAKFARLASQKRDIILHTTGESARPYCYTMDCVSAILYILLKGKSCEAYNVANADTFISAKELAEYLRDNFSPSIHVRIELNEKMGYAPMTRLHLSCEKLMALGWKPMYNLKEMLEKLITSMK